MGFSWATKLFLSLFLAVFMAPFFLNAQVFSSSNFEIHDPVIDFGGDRSTSASFILLQAFGQLALGTSTSGTFRVISGFLPFPVVSVPTPTATAGSGSADISWSPAVGFLGWRVSGYNIGRATVSGGPYTYTTIASTTSATISGLTNGTTYYFVLRPQDAFGNSLATSTEASATPQAAAAAPGAPSRSYPTPVSVGSVIFRGLAYPHAAVILLRDSQPVVQARAGSEGDFELTSRNIGAGVHTFGIFAEDTDGRVSRLITYTVQIEVQKTTIVQGIILPPTISLDKSAVQQGDILYVTGQSTPLVRVEAALFREDALGETILGEALSATDGRWSIAFPTAGFEFGEYEIFARSFIENIRSPVSQMLEFLVGPETIFLPPEACTLKGDLNNDCRVELVDFSIAAYWFKQPLSPEFLERERTQLSGDGVVDFKDFSLMAFWWTG